MRLALRYAVLYALLAGAALAAFYWATARYVDQQLRAGLEEEFLVLRDRMRAKGLPALVDLVRARSEAADREGRYYLLEDKAGNRLAGNLLFWPPDSDFPEDGEIHPVWVEDDIIPGSDVEDDAYWPVIGARLADGSRLLVARGVKEAEALQFYGLIALFSLLGVVVLLALAMGVFMGRAILRRMDAIDGTAREIMAGNLSRRMPVSGRGDEFDVLSQRLNEMLTRIEQLLKGMREVTDNVAHDLRSPLTRMRNRLEVTLLETREAGEYRRVMEQAIADADQLVATFNAILQIAQAEAGSLPASMGRVDLCQVARQLGELYGPLAEERGQRLTVETCHPLVVQADRDLLGQALGNLLDNAVKYTPAGGRIAMTVKDGEEGACVSVNDTGPGIPEPERARVLRRFVRLEAARSTPGNGLGLSLVNAVARMHGARLALENSNPGLRVSLCFPRTKPG